MGSVAVLTVRDLTPVPLDAGAGIIGIIALFIGMPFSSKLLKGNRRLKVRCDRRPHQEHATCTSALICQT